MARTLLLRIDPTATEASWQLVENGQLVGPSGKGKLEDARRAARGVPVVVLVQSEEIFLDNVALPGKNRQKLRRAIPYAVEDQLIDEIDNLHFALSTHAQHGRYLIAAVEDRMMDYWDKSILNAGIRAETIIPDVTALPQSDTEWTVLLENTRAMVRTQDELFATDIASLPVMLENLSAAREDSEPPRVTLYDCSNDDKAILLQAAVPQIQFDVIEAPQGVFEVFARSYEPRTSVNLLQGEYNRQEGWRKQLKPWYPAAALLAFWLGWQLVLAIGAYVDLRRTSEQLTLQMRAVHKRAFPSSKTPAPGYERNDMAARLKELQKRQGQAAGGLQEMLVRTAPVLKNISNITIEGIHYLNGSLDVELTMKDTSQLEALKDRLQTQTGWDVKSQASTEKGITRVRLKITSKG
jgi:general secretion pathway protein L